MAVHMLFWQPTVQSMKMTLKLLLIVAGAMTCLPGAAVPQSKTEFIQAFTGDWTSFDPRFAKDKPCIVTLAVELETQKLHATANHCLGEIAAIAAWDIVDGKLVIAGQNDSEIARLGGSQQRMTGELTNGTGVVLERGIDQYRAISGGDIRSGACLYFGYTASCSAPGYVETPINPGPNDLISLTTLVDLQSRATPRPGAAEINVVPRKTCVKVNGCVTASDGLWCEIEYTGVTGWVRQQAIRKDTWPVLTFIEGCGTIPFTR